MSICLIHTCNLPIEKSWAKCVILCVRKGSHHSSYVLHEDTEEVGHTFSLSHFNPSFYVLTIISVTAQRLVFREILKAWNSNKVKTILTAFPTSIVRGSVIAYKCSRMEWTTKRLGYYSNYTNIVDSEKLGS